MKNLQAIISKSVNNASMQFERLGSLTTNAANYNTYAYKSVRFENFLQENGYIRGAERTDFSVGSVYNTGRELDIAIKGAGFIPVTQKDGNVAYTRNGSFKVNNERLLTTLDGSIVGNGIKIPANVYRVKIQPDGTVSCRMDLDQKEQTLGKLPLVNFNNPEGLKVVDGNNLVPTEESGEAFLVKNHDFIQQGSLERSNVNIFATVNDVMKINASLIAGTRMIKFTDEIYRQSINLRQ